MAPSMFCLRFFRHSTVCLPMKFREGTLPQKYLLRQLHRGHKVLQTQNASSDNSSSDPSEDETRQPQDPGEIKLRILEAGLNFVTEHGWSRAALAAGAKSIGLSSAAHGIFPSGGTELVHYLNSLNNSKLEHELKENSGKDEEKKDLRTYLEDALESRLRVNLPYISKWPEAMAMMVLPQHVGSHTQNVMDLVDTVWFYSEDKSVNMRWYTKRISLAAAYKASELSLVQDKSPDYIDTWEFLERRIQMVTDMENCAQQFHNTYHLLSEVCDGAFRTIPNIMGLNRWRR